MHIRLRKPDRQLINLPYHGCHTIHFVIKHHHRHKCHDSHHHSPRHHCQHPLQPLPRPPPPFPPKSASLSPQTNPASPYRHHTHHHTIISGITHIIITSIYSAASTKKQELTSISQR